MKPTVKKLITQTISWIAVGGILWLLLSRFFTNLEEFQSLEVFRFRPIIAAAALLGFSAVIAWWGIVWWVILPPDERKKLTLPQVFHIQAVSWLARYVPGKAGSILGKIILGKKQGISGRTLILAGGYEQLLQVISAFIIGFGFVGWAWVQETGQSAVAVLALVILVAIFTLLHPKFFYPVSNKALTLFNRKPLQSDSLLSFSQLLGVTAMYALGHFMNGLAFFLMVKSISPVMNASVFIFVGSFVLAGVLGVVSLFAPSGLGVREGVMTGLLSIFFPMEEALLYSLMSRIFTTLADGGIVLYWAGFNLYQKGWGKSIEWIIYGTGLGILLVLPLIYTGSYIDEYWHVFAGRGWVENWQFPEIYIGEPYTRGAYLSVIAGIIQDFFGNNLYLLKLLPITIAALTWYFLREIACKVYGQASVISRIGLFLLWFASPWLLVNHLYIRNYIFYEFILVFLIWWGMYLPTKKPFRWYIESIFIGLILAVFVFLDNQPNSILLTIPYAIILDINYWTRKDLLVSQTVQRMVVGVFWTLAGVIGMYAGIIGDFLTREFTFATDKNYFEFLFIDQTILFLMSLVGAGIFIIKKDSAKRMIGWVYITLVTLHFISSEDIHLIRNLFYLMPIMYLLVIAGAREISHFRHWQSRLFVRSIGAIIILFGYAQAFPSGSGYFTGPYIPGEINYIDYAKAYQYVEDNCSDKQIFETSPTPFIANFYGVEVTPIITNINRLDKDRVFLPTESGYEINLTNTSVVTDISDLPESYCWIRRSPSLGNYLTNTSAQGEVTKFVGIEVIQK
jgi:hypothetical protein